MAIGLTNCEDQDDEDNDHAALEREAYASVVLNRMAQIPAHSSENTTRYKVGGDHHSYACTYKPPILTMSYARCATVSFDSAGFES